MNKGFFKNLSFLTSRSIRNRIIRNFGIIVILTVLVVQIFFILMMRRYYYGGVEQILKDRVSITTDFVNRNAVASSINEKAMYLFESLITAADDRFLIQVLDEDGYVLRDSNGFSEQRIINTPDVKAALHRKIVVYKGLRGDMDEKIMAVSRPLLIFNSVNGVVRYSVSLEKVNQVLFTYTMGIMIAGFIIIGFFLVMAFIISQSIVDPIKKLTSAAAEMALGDFEIRAEKVNDDEIGQLTDTINFMASEITKAENLKKEFISSISHELRTPLTSIKGWGETLLVDDVPTGSPMEVGLKIICSETDRLQHIVEELLDFSRLESSSLKVQKVIMDPKNVLENVYRQFLPKSGEVKMTCTLLGPDTMVYGDRNRIRQVYINLIANAFKFTNPGGRILLTGEGFEDKVVITVQDDGIGISEENIKKVKERFFKVSLNSPGSGLGLSIVEEILKAHNATLDIYSQEGQGTSMVITFPALQGTEKKMNLMEGMES